MAGRIKICREAFDCGVPKHGPGNQWERPGPLFATRTESSSFEQTLVHMSSNLMYVHFIYIYIHIHIYNIILYYIISYYIILCYIILYIL